MAVLTRGTLITAQGRLTTKQQGGPACKPTRNRASASSTSVGTNASLMEWLQSVGMHDVRVRLESVERDEGNVVDTVVAAEQLQPGDLALRVPDPAVVTLDRVFQDATVAELLTDNKLSELACLTLYMMYEKKQGRQSFWYEYIKELDRQRGRGQMGAKSPLLWEDEQVSQFLQGSPLQQQVKQRLQGIEREYNELDTVWFMAGSLFNNYPYSTPTEEFSLKLFREAFAAVQASVVHLQGVPLSRRFALIPLGPPMLTYSSTCKAMLTYNHACGSVELVADRPIAAGQPVTAWCGPQPNSRLLLNYGIVDENNPYDKLQLTAVLASSDPLFRPKRKVLTDNQLSSSQAFDVTRSQPLPPKLLPFLRLALTNCESSVANVLFEDSAPPLDQATETLAVELLLAYAGSRLSGYPTTIEQDSAIINDPSAGVRHKVASRLVRIEKQMLEAMRKQLLEHADKLQLAVGSGAVPHTPSVKLV